MLLFSQAKFYLFRCQKLEFGVTLPISTLDKINDKEINLEARSILEDQSCYLEQK